MRRIVIIVIILVLITGCIDISSSSTSEKERNMTKYPVTTTIKSPVETTKKIVTPIQTIQSVNANLLSIANKTMTYDESWDVGNGWLLSVVYIDAQTTMVWLVLKKDGIKVSEETPKVGQSLTYNKSNKFFSLKVSSIFLGKVKHNMSTAKDYILVDQNFVTFEDIKYN